MNKANSIIYPIVKKTVLMDHLQNTHKEFKFFSIKTS